MSVSTVMACLSVGRSNADLLSVVGDVARRFGARVIGVAARQMAMHPYVRGVGPFEPQDYDPRKFAEQAKGVEAKFRAALADVPALEFRMQITSGPPCQYVANEARSADLVVAPIEPNGRASFSFGEAEVGDLLMRLGRPIMTAPTGAKGFAFRQALVCFKDVREARRALSDSLPILRRMQRTRIVEIVETEMRECAARRLADVGDWLSRHGVEATLDVLLAKGSAANQLAAYARDIDADLLVAGAFGHNRLREWAFGGVTHDLVLRSDRCVLSSH